MVGHATSLSLNKCGLPAHTVPRTTGTGTGTVGIPGLKTPFFRITRYLSSEPPQMTSTSELFLRVVVGTWKQLKSKLNVEWLNVDSTCCLRDVAHLGSPGSSYLSTFCRDGDWTCSVLPSDRTLKSGAAIFGFVRFCVRPKPGPKSGTAFGQLFARFCVCGMRALTRAPTSTGNRNLSGRSENADAHYGCCQPRCCLQPERDSAVPSS